jgi:formate hydrogenlyase subunit 3/multisubunit Na+/H+ antiporter MnhD subunit
VTLLLVALATLAFGGVLALFASPWARVASALGAASAVAGCVLGIVYAVGALVDGEKSGLALAWQIPYGAFRIEIDALSAFFLVPVFSLSAAAAVYGHDYLLAYRARKSLGVPWLAYGVLVSSMAIVVVARQAVLFLVAWEVMSLSAYVLVTFEHEDTEVSRAGWTYLIATHIGTACLIAFFLFLGRDASSFDFDALATAAHARPAPTAALMALAIVGFGVKAGFVPLHVWLPEAHAAAPSHVSAVMSGVLVKMGLYGLLRATVIVAPSGASIGALLAAIGLVSACIGISLSLYQRDMKRVLAYSTIENVGIITLGLGVGFWSSAAGLPHAAAIATAGALLHIWNHTWMKGLMFLGAGSVLHGCGTKDLEKLGGVLRRMPRTGTLMIVGAVALAALPPLNGFASEWLVYLGLIETAQRSAGAAAVVALLAVGAVAFVGALAVLSFVRLVGTGLLGQPRSEGTARAHESPIAMTAPMAVLAIALLVVGVVPGAVVAATARATAQLLPNASDPTAAPATVAPIGTAHSLVWIVLAATTLLALPLVRRRSATGPTWGCGYAAPTARMQYTARSFAEMGTEQLVPKAIGPRVSAPVPSAIFPSKETLYAECSDPVTRGVYEPLLVRTADRIARLRGMQKGVLHVYLLYIAVAVIVAFGWATLRSGGAP